MNSVVLILFLTLWASSGLACTVGRCYPISEPDLLEEIRRQASQIPAPTITARHLQGDVPPSPCLLARQHRSRLVDISVTLTQAVHDQEGHRIYPAGFRYSPLERLHYPRNLLIFCGDSPEELQVVSTLLAQDPSFMLLSLTGDLQQLRRHLKRAVYRVPPQLQQRFGIVLMPAVVRQAGRMLRVDEYPVPRRRP